MSLANNSKVKERLTLKEWIKRLLKLHSSPYEIALGVAIGVFIAILPLYGLHTVLVIDMIRGFLEKEFPLYCGDRARQIIPNIQRLLETELAQGSRVFFICDHHDPDDREFRVFPPHCVTGTVQTEVIPELAGYPGEIIPKKRYSGFYGTDLAARLEALHADKLIVCRFP